MKHNYIRGAIKKMKILLAALCLWEGLFFLLLNIVLRNVIATQERFVMLIIGNLFVTAVSVIIDSFMIRKIFRLRSLLCVRPISCKVEDFIVTSYNSAGDRRYRADLLVRDTETDQLLLTYKQYSLSFYNSTVMKAGHSLLDIRIARKDGSTVQLGDSVDVYIKRFVNVTATQKDGKLFLNKKPFVFRHVNPAHGIHSLMQTKFFEGAVVVE